MFWHHFSLYCASQKSAHGAKMCLCTGDDQDKCLEVDTTTPESQTPPCLLFTMKFTHAYLQILLRKQQGTFVCLGADDRLTKTRNKPWCMGPGPCSHCLWLRAPCLPHAGRARGHHEDHQQSQNMPKVM